MTAFTVDPWDPSYGQASGDEQAALDDSTAELDVDLELPAASWCPLDPAAGVVPPDVVLFLDGVRRIDARVWVHGGGQPATGIAASLAAGVVACDGTARVADVAVERGLFTAAAEAGDIRTRAAVYPARRAAGPGFDQLSLAMQQRLSDIEIELALAVRASRLAADDLLVVDGPLRGRVRSPQGQLRAEDRLDKTVGYIKTHHASYLPEAQAAVVGALRPGQRTPAFAIGTTWRRTSWYLQLPAAGGAPWAGVVRIECSPDLAPEEVTELADLTARVLPPLASAPHKDPRAPQNLVPIGGLERELRRRLGDQQLLYRALRAAALSA
ncbi:MAG TPA: DNA double-strand break repair nuclease NurA [Streptosporangiaceae bacterium]